jgi:hypothetical protein
MQERLMRPAGSNEFHFLAEPLAKLSKAANSALGVYEDEEGLAARPRWQQRLVSKMRRKGWMVDLRQWAEFPSLVWLVGVNVVFFMLSRLILKHPVAIALSFVCLGLASVLTGAFALTR